MNRIGILALLLAPIACDDGLFSPSDIDTDTDADTDVDIPDDPPDHEWSSDLSEGAIIDLTWADDSAIACWPGTEDVNFSGNHVFFDVDQPDDSTLVISADPAHGVDVSLYVIQFGQGDASHPPNVFYCKKCEAAFDQEDDGNPGETESLQILNTHASDVVIGVAGANGATSGAFTLRVWEEEGPHFGTDSP